VQIPSYARDGQNWVFSVLGQDYRLQAMSNSFMVDSRAPLPTVNTARGF
jgi:hypothetical protein